MTQTKDDVALQPRRGRPRDPERLRRIVEAAHTHFNAHGLERASVDAIAADAGVSKMTMIRDLAAYLRRADATGRQNIRHPHQAADLVLSMLLGDAACAAC